MSQLLEAVFEHGVFRLLQPIAEPISEGRHVRLKVETEPASEDLLELAGQVYDGLSVQQMNEIEQIALDRRNFSFLRSCVRTL
ncbi:MAG: antitoxin family protein [Candidatus Latescibacteria bacterium]|nr:antitoxin family protein [Candidatus Latescibacterota bacterium]